MIDSRIMVPMLLPPIPSARSASSTGGCRGPLVTITPRLAVSSRPWWNSSGRPCDVGDDSAGLGDNQGPRGVVPDLLAVVGARRQPEIDVGLAAGDDGIFGLAVHPERRGRDSQPGGDGRRVALRTVPRLDRLAEPRVRRIVAATDGRSAPVPARLLRSSSRPALTKAPCPLTA